MGDRTKYAKEREKDRRDKISISKHLKKLSEIQAELHDDSKSPNVPALRLSADISINLLKKRLPDLKAVEGKLKVDGEWNLNLISFVDATPEQLDS